MRRTIIYHNGKPTKLFLGEVEPKKLAWYWGRKGYVIKTMAKGGDLNVGKEG